MTLRPEYSLGHSPYNAFLFAAVGEEKTGVLTVLTALTRLGLDPWLEAARLAALPRETAARALAAKIAMLPEGDWKASESEAIAARLVSWLPNRSIQAIPSVEGELVGGKNMNSELARGLAWVVLAAALLFFALHYFSNNNLESGGGMGLPTQHTQADAAIGTGKTGYR